MSRKAITLLVTLTALIIIEFKSEVFNESEDTKEGSYIL